MFETVRNKISQIMSSVFKQPLENFNNHVTKWVSHGRMGGLLDYREADFQELINLSMVYDENIRPRSAASNSNESASVLDIDMAGKKPKASEHEILRSFIFERNSNHGDLLIDMEFIFNLIKACTNARFYSFETKGYNHINGAVILFSAEMASWANKVAKLKIDKNLLDEVDKRISYLIAIEKNKIFKNEPKADYAVGLLIVNLRKILEKVVKPQIQAQISKESAREHFEMLTKQSRNFFHLALQGIFYLYTSETGLQELFNVHSYDIVKHSGLEKALKTHLGFLVEKLATAYKNAVGLQFTNNTQALDRSRSNDRKMLSLGEIKQLLQLRDTHEKSVSGIHPIMSKPNMIEQLAVFLSLLEKFSLFINAFMQAYVLAGHGGNLLVYLGLCREINQIFSCYTLIEEKLLNHLTVISQISENEYDNLVWMQEENPWTQQYLRSVEYFSRAREALSACDSKIHSIRCSMNSVLSRDYESEIREQMKNFRRTIALIESDLKEGEDARVTIEDVTNNQDQRLIDYNNNQITQSFIVEDITPPAGTEAESNQIQRNIVPVSTPVNSQQLLAPTGLRSSTLALIERVAQQSAALQRRNSNSNVSGQVTGGSKVTKNP